MPSYSGIHRKINSGLINWGQSPIILLFFFELLTVTTVSPVLKGDHNDNKHA